MLGIAVFLTMRAMESQTESMCRPRGGFRCAGPALLAGFTPDALSSAVIEQNFHEPQPFDGSTRMNEEASVGASELARQLSVGNFVDNWDFWLVFLCLHAIFSYFGFKMARRNADATESGRLDALNRRFDEALTQLSASKAVEHQAELRKELLLRLATALGDSLLLVTTLGRLDSSDRDFPEKARKLGLEVNVCRIAASPSTIAATSTFMEAFARNRLSLWERKCRLEEAGVIKERDMDALARDVVKVTADLDELLCIAQACIRDELGFGGRETFLEAMDDNRKRIRTFFV